MTTAPRFDAHTTRATLEVACKHGGLDAHGAELVRMGENAMYRLATGNIMARVGRSVEASRKELHVADWLGDHRFPAARLAEVPQPVADRDVAVTFWEFIESCEPPARSAELGAVLRDLHSLPAPRFSLPDFQPMPKVDDRLAKVGPSLPSRELEFLAHRKQDLEEQFQSLDFELEVGPIHGDAHRSNLLRDCTTGQVRLIDFEDFCVGPREWDLCVEAVGYWALNWISDADYESYVEACGFDALSWPGFKVVRAIRELNMTTWLAQMLGQSSEVDAEVMRRIRDLRNEDVPRDWRPF
ncbi:MAG: phosphotransferase [Actinophytocola sp.]|nr:phosphotransferase [Actinophytocola sp.]